MYAPIFATTARRQRRNEWQVQQMYSATSRSHSMAMNGCRKARLARGVAWTFTCRSLQIEKSNGFESCKYWANPPESVFKNCRVGLKSAMSLNSSQEKNYFYCGSGLKKQSKSFRFLETIFVLFYCNCDVKIKSGSLFTNFQ
jgi:hypothetical protein